MTRLMRQAGLEGRCKKRWRKTTVPDPDAERPATSSSATSDRAKRSTGATSATSPTSRRGRAGPTWPRSSTWPADGWSAGRWPTTCAPSSSKTPSRWPSPTARPAEGRHLPFRPRLSIHQRDFAELARANGVVLSVGRKGECWDNAVAESFFATIKRELIDTRAWPTRAGLRPRRLRVHRGLVQHPPAAFVARLPQPRPVRSTHHNADRQAA